MIRNDEELNQARAAIIHLESALEALKRDVLSINPARFALMAEPAVDQIRELRAQLEEYVGITSAVSQEAEVWMRIAGPEIEIGDAPTSVVTQMLDILRRGVQTVAEFLQRGAVAARPTTSLKQACDLRIVGWMPGSVQVGLRLPEIPLEEPGGLSASHQAREALGLYLDAASWVGSEAEPDELERTIPDREQRRLLLNQIARIVPRPRGAAETVELSGRLMRGPVQLKRASRQRVRTALLQTITEELVTVTGLLREIDLDGRSFIIRDPEVVGKERRCEISPEADDLLEIAKEALDHPVEVSGSQGTEPTRRKVYPLQVREIEVLDQSDTDPSS